jgi:RimJ/RimL family protein N-acetyltransferase
MGLALRPASPADAELLWEWRNEKSTRLNSFDEAPIPWSSHVAWLERKLASRECRIWILQDDGHPVGQIRFERENGQAMVNYSIDAQHRGRGLGTEILKRSVPHACRELGTHTIAGVAKSSNLASCRAFMSAGFTRAAEVLNAGCACIRFEYPCPPSRLDGSA